MEESIKRRHKPLERRARTVSWPAPRFFTRSTRRRQWPSFAGLKQEISARDDAKGRKKIFSVYPLRPPASLRETLRTGLGAKKRPPPGALAEFDMKNPGFRSL